MTINSFNPSSPLFDFYLNEQPESMYSFLDDLAARDDLSGYPNFDPSPNSYLEEEKSTHTSHLVPEMVFGLTLPSHSVDQNNTNVSDNNTNVTEFESEIVFCLTPPFSSAEQNNIYASDFAPEMVSSTTSTSCPLDPFNSYPYVQEASDIVPMNPETAVSTTTPPDSTQGSTSRKRNHETMSNQSSPASQAEIDLALIEANKKRKISQETISLNYLAKLSYSEIKKNGWLVEECKKINPNFIQENQSYINWCKRFQNFTKGIVEDFKANPEKLDLDNTLEKAYWDLLSEKFIIPNVINVYLLYYKNFQVKINQYRNILKNQNDIILLNECETKVNKINNILLEIQDEYNLYKSNHIQVNFIKNITTHVKKLSKKENSFCLLKSKLLTNDKDLSNDNNDTEIYAESPRCRLIWTEKHNKAFYEIASGCGVKKGQPITCLQARQIAAEMTKQFKFPFTQSMCRSKLYRDLMKGLESTSDQEPKKHSIFRWKPKHIKKFYEIGSKCGLKKGENLVDFESFNKIAERLNSIFGNFFTGQICYSRAYYDFNKFQKSIESTSVQIDETDSSATVQTKSKLRPQIYWTEEQVEKFYEIGSEWGVIKGKNSISIEAAEVIAAKMNGIFGNFFTPTRCLNKVHNDYHRAIRKLERPPVQIDETNSSETVQTKSKRKQINWTKEQVEKFYEIGSEYGVIKGQKSIDNEAAKEIAAKMKGLYGNLFTPQRCKNKVYNDYSAAKNLERASLQKDKTNPSQTDKTSTSEPETSS